MVGGIEINAQKSTIYDLQGRPTDAKQRGFYIINGKKVIK